MKRILLLFSALMLSCIALWAHDVVKDGIYYNLDETNKTAEVTYSGHNSSYVSDEYSGSVTIPETITCNSEIYSVTSIGSEAFYKCTGLTSVTIPNSVTYIGAWAFFDCSGLTSITIPNSVTSITGAFVRCGNLRSVVWNAKNCEDFIQYSPFDGICSNITSFTFGNEVEHIPAYLCLGMSKLTEITIPNSVTSIGSVAFTDCSGLTSVTIGNSVTSIGSSAFSRCSGLTSVTIPNNVTSIGYNAFIDCSGLTEVTIGNSVTSIGSNAFSGCSGLTSVIWNAKNCEDFKYEIYIGTSTSPFYNIRSSITSFTFGNEVEHIPAYLCYGMNNLKGVTIGKSVTSIASSAFSGCSGLTKVNYLGTVDKWVDIDFEDYRYNPTYYAKDLYINNELLTDVKITIADSIKKYAFYNCQSIKSVEIGNSVTSIGSSAFYNCSGLTKVNYLGTVDKWVEFDWKYGDSNPTYYAKDLYINNELLTDVKITTADSIKKYAFYNCQSIKSVEIGNSVTSIGSSAFSGCSGLTSVIWNAKNYKDFEDYNETPFYNIRSNITSFTFGNEVEHIPAYLCYGMSKLSEVTIPNSVTSIGEDAFSGCSGLTSVIWNAKNCEDISSSENSPFYDIRSKITSFTFGNEVEHIPAYLCYRMSKLTEITIPNSVTSIGEDAFYSCSGLTSVIWNAKNCEDFSSFTYSPFYDIRSSLTSFTFGNEVEHIPAYLCNFMNNLKEVTIGKSITSIGQHAFFECSGLTKVNYLGTVDKWVGLDWIHVSSNPTYYAKDLYINNELLTDVKITSADSIKGCAFINCQSIKSVEIGNSVTSIGQYAFFECSGLTKVNYLGTVDKWVEIDFDDDNLSLTYYAKDLYINNELLTDVKITTADSIKNYAFYNCQSIKSVEIGESVTSIGSSAFSGCDKLKKVTAYPTTVPNAYESSFAHYNAYLYVPCDVYEDYDLDDVFGSFKYIKCIAAEEVDAPEKIEIEVDEDNNAIVIWPSTDGAKKYELEISKDGEVFCTLLFNENGQLTSIDFGNRSASVGFQFTVTGLDSASKYAYSMVAMDKKGNELQSYKGTFTTNGYVPGPGEEDEPTSITENLADANITISNGHITCPDTEFAIYNTIGQDVTAFNGSLQPGVYLVSIENNIVKVMVH